MKRCLSVLLMLSVFLGSLSGCGGSQPDNAGSKAADSKTETQASGDGNKTVTEVNVWTGEGSSKNTVLDLVDQYNQTEGQEKGIKINYTVHGGDYKNTISMALEVNEAPDLFALNSLLIAKEAYAKDQIVAIEDIPGGADFLKGYEGYISPLWKVKGKTLSVPFSATTCGLLYNKDMFKKYGIVDEKGEAKPPRTWKEVSDYAKKLTNPSEKTYGIALPLKWTAGYFLYEMSMPFRASQGKEFFDQTTGKFDFESFRPGLEWLLTIKKDNSYFPGPEGLDNDPARAQFAEGRVGMKLGVSWDVGVLNEQFPAKIDWGVAPVPVLDENNAYKQGYNTSPFVYISKSATGEKAEKIAEVFKWFNSDEVLAKLYEEGKYIPYKQEVMNLVKKEPAQKGWKEFAGMVANSERILITPDVKLEGDDYKHELMKVWVGSSSIDDAIKTLNDRYNQALQKGIDSGDIDIAEYKTQPAATKAE